MTEITWVTGKRRGEFATPILSIHPYGVRLNRAARAALGDPGQVRLGVLPDGRVVIGVDETNGYRPNSQGQFGGASLREQLAHADGRYNLELQGDVLVEVQS